MGADLPVAVPAAAQCPHPVGQPAAHDPRPQVLPEAVQRLMQTLKDLQPVRGEPTPADTVAGRSQAAARPGAGSPAPGGQAGAETTQELYFNTRHFARDPAP